MERKLYQWQEECLERWFANNGRGIVQAVTGAGKTLLALTAAEQLEKKLGRQLRVKIVVPTGALMHQWNRALQEFFSDSPVDRDDQRKEIGMRGGGCKTSADSRYMIYVINSARYELARKILTELRNGEAVFLIADECHHYGSGQNQLIFEFLPYINLQTDLFFSLGLSATLPSGRTRHSLTSALGRNIYSYEIENALAHRTVCQYHIYHIKLSFQKEEREVYEDITEQMKVLYGRLFHIYPILGNMTQGERCEFLRSISGDKTRRTAKMAFAYLGLVYKRRSLVCQASARTVCVRDLTAKLGIHEKILIFGERIEQAEMLYKILQELYPERVGRYHSRMGQQANKNVLERFRIGDIRILIACKSLDEGVNIPDASVGIILSGTSGQRQRVQRLGRIIRRTSGKDTASLYYLHIEETIEDVCFLPDTEDSYIFELEYSSALYKFINPFYDKISAMLLNKIQKSGMDQEKIKEVERCLELGCVRSDWMLEEEKIEEHIKRARYASDRNYWICMKNMRMLIP